MLMAISTKENGGMMLLVALEHSWTAMEQCMLENGKEICSMDKGKKVGKEERPSMLDNSLKERKMAKENLSGKMAATMKEILLMDSFKDMASTILLI